MGNEMVIDDLRQLASKTRINTRRSVITDVAKHDDFSEDFDKKK